jgi:hypothetical protein
MKLKTFVLFTLDKLIFTIQASRRSESGMGRNLEFQHYLSKPSQPDDWQLSTPPNLATGLEYFVFLDL